MTRSKKSQFPPEILVYEADRTEDGEQILGAVANIDELTDDMNGQYVGVYARVVTRKLSVKRILELT